MMNRLLVVSALAFLPACGVPRDKHEAVVSERDSLSKHLEHLMLEVDELRNGAARRSGEIRDAFESGNHKDVVSGATLLQEKHPGSPEAIAAQALKAKSERALAADRERAQREAERRAAEAARSDQEKTRSILRVASVRTDEPNSAGGVDLRIRWQNRSDKTIKYITFYVRPFNAVGDEVTCSIRDYSQYGGRVTGPIKPGQWHGDGYSWETAWYNNTIVRAKLEEVRIEYLDGSTATIGGANIAHVQF